MARSQPAAHGHGLRRTNPPSALRVKFAMKVRKRAQQRWSRLRLCTLSSKCVLPSVTHPVTVGRLCHACQRVLHGRHHTDRSQDLPSRSYPEPSDLT